LSARKIFQQINSFDSHRVLFCRSTISLLFCVQPPIVFLMTPPLLPHFIANSNFLIFIEYHPPEESQQQQQQQQLQQQQRWRSEQRRPQHHQQQPLQEQQQQRQLCPAPLPCPPLPTCPPPPSDPFSSFSSSSYSSSNLNLIVSLIVTSILTAISSIACLIFYLSQKNLQKILYDQSIAIDLSQPIPPPLFFRLCVPLGQLPAPSLSFSHASRPSRSLSHRNPRQPILRVLPPRL
jgi:hypothetical protein